MVDRCYAKQHSKLLHYQNLFPNKPQCFVYVSDNNGVTLGLVNPKSLTVTFLEKLPSFESIKNTNIAQGRIEKKQESKRAIDTFVVTWLRIGYFSGCYSSS